MKPYSANKAKLFLQISSFHKILMFTFKKVSCAVYWDLGASLLLYSSPLFACLILRCKSALRGRHSLSHENKKLMTFVYLLKTKKYQKSILLINMLVCIILIVNSVLFQFRSYARETLVHLRETWVENDVSFSTSILCTKK